MRLSHDSLVGPQNHLNLVSVNVKASENQDKTTESGVTTDSLEPIVVKIEQNHLGLSGSQNQVSKLLNLERGLEWQLQLTSLEHDVREIEAMYCASDRA
jgi:hypothetical protein